MDPRIPSPASRLCACDTGIYAAKLPADFLGVDSGSIESRSIGYRGIQLYVCYVNGMADRIGRINCAGYIGIFNLHW
jgi:hypothetical protein